MDAHLPVIAVPGQPLAAVNSYIPGPGTHVQHSFICASIAGPVVVGNSESRQSQRATLIVARSYSQRYHLGHGDVSNTAAAGTVERHRPVYGPSSGGSGRATGTPHGKQTTKQDPTKFNTLPAVDSTLLARVTRVQKRQAAVSILFALH